MNMKNLLEKTYGVKEEYKVGNAEIVFAVTLGFLSFALVIWCWVML